MLSPAIKKSGAPGTQSLLRSNSTESTDIKPSEKKTTSVFNKIRGLFKSEKKPSSEGYKQLGRLEY
jgi:hypothetical protein